MKRGLIKKCIGISFLALFGYLLFASVIKWSDNKGIKERLKSFDTDGMIRLNRQALSLEDFLGRYLLVILFNSECDFCQQEARDIQSNIEALGETKVLMVSTESFRQIQDFQKRFKLIHPNIQLARIEPEKAHQKFGKFSFPKLFLYNPEGDLIETFNGRTKMSTIIGELKRDGAPIIEMIPPSSE